MTKVFCDACGKEMPDEAERAVITITHSVGHTGNDLCIVCATRIAAKINCFIAEIKEQEKSKNEQAGH